MLYILGAIALVLIIYGLILFIKRGNKEFNPKLTFRERAELEKIIEKKNKSEDDENEREKKEIIADAKEKFSETPLPKSRAEFPSKDISNEISRFETFVDINNSKLQLAIRNGVQNFLNHDYMVALEEFSLATESNPSDATGFYCRALIKLQIKNYESSIIDFTEAINLKMSGPNTFYFRALSYYNLHDYDNAILNLNAYLNQEKNNSEAYFDLGLCFKEKDKLDEGIKNFSLAIQKRPTHAGAYFERGLIRHKQNDKEGGCADLKKSFGLGNLQAENYLNELCSDGSV